MRSRCSAAFALALRSSSSFPKGKRQAKERQHGREHSVDRATNPSKQTRRQTAIARRYLDAGDDSIFSQPR